MKSWAQTIAWYEKEYPDGGPLAPSKSEIKKVFEAFRDNLPQLQLQKRAYVNGLSIEIRVHGQAGNLKIVSRGVNPDMFIYAFFEGIRQPASTTAFGTMKWAFGDYIAARLTDLMKEETHGIDRVMKVIGKNRVIAEQKHKAEAMASLNKLMASWLYTREEVLTAWDLDQVKRVMES